MDKNDRVSKKIADGCGAELDSEKRAHFYDRSYKAVDELWFLKIEEKYGFVTALKIDQEVWKIMPKIQARTMRSILELGNDWESFEKSIMTKLTWEGFRFEVKKSPNEFQNSNQRMSVAQFNAKKWKRKILRESWNSDL